MFNCWIGLHCMAGMLKHQERLGKAQKIPTFCRKIRKGGRGFGPLPVRKNGVKSLFLGLYIKNVEQSKTFKSINK